MARGIRFPPGASGAPHDDQRRMAFLDNTTLLDTNDGGINGLTNPQNPSQFDHWVSADGNIQDTEFFKVVYDSFNGVIFGGNQDNGTPVQSSPNSPQWNGVGGGDGGTVAVDDSGGQSVDYFFNNYGLGYVVNGQLPVVGAQLAGGPFQSALYGGFNPLDRLFMSGIPATAITGASNTTGPIVINTSSTGILVKGGTVTVSGVTGNTNANGTWTVSNVMGNSFTLKGMRR